MARRRGAGAGEEVEPVGWSRDMAGGEDHLYWEGYILRRGAAAGRV